MEDMATGEIRLSILWEWLHKGATLTADDGATGTREGDRFSAALFARLLDEEYGKLLAASDRDVHDDSKATTLPIARAIVEAYVASEVKPPWYIDLLNLNLGLSFEANAAGEGLAVARGRIAGYLERFARGNTRLTANLDWSPASST
jgi:malate synthase